MVGADATSVDRECVVSCWGLEAGAGRWGAGALTWMGTGACCIVAAGEGVVEGVGVRTTVSD